MRLSASSWEVASASWPVRPSVRETTFARSFASSRERRPTPANEFATSLPNRDWNQLTTAIRRREEPLSHHIGRGAAKFQDHGFTHAEIAYGAFCIYEEEQCAGKCSGAEANWYLAIERLKRIRQGVPYA